MDRVAQVTDIFHAQDLAQFEFGSQTRDEKVSRRKGRATARLIS
jgi:hypothetical protein